MIFTRPLIVLDTETTGLLEDPDAMPWEIGAVLLNTDGNEVDSFSGAGRPSVFERRHREIVRSISGVDPEVVAALPTSISRVADEFLRWLQHCDLINGVFPVECAAFNVGFDSLMLARIGARITDWQPCLMLRAKEEMGPNLGEPGSRLQRAAAFYGVPQQEPAHRALADARTAGLIAVEMAKRAQEKTHAYT